MKRVKVTPMSHGVERMADIAGRADSIMPPADMVDIPSLARGQRLYIVTGPEWEVALDDFRSEEPSAPVWLCDSGWRKDDLFLTILGTRPRVILCLEWAEDADPGDNINVRDCNITFPDGISLNAVQNQLPFDIRGGRYYTGVQGNQILDAVRGEHWTPSPWFAPRPHYPGPI